MESTRTLYQFPLSLYCEKTRWNLDHKQLPYRCANLVPGPHLPRARWLAGISTLPILREARGTVGDSTQIAIWLDRHYPEHPLLPVDPVARERVLMLEGYFDELGDHVRRCVWGLAVNGPGIDHIFFGFSGYPRWLQALARITTPVLRLMLLRRFRLQPKRIEQSWARVTAGLDHIEALLEGDENRFLAGDTFTLADLTAATMLAPLIGPEGSPWSDSRLKMAPNSGREVFRERLAGRWVLKTYARFRETRLAT